jgi:hypothetical protein
VVFKEGYRKKENFACANWFALDFETPELSLAEALKIFCDMTHVIGTTRNHRVTKGGVTLDRFRVLLRADRMMDDLHTYEWNLKRVGQRYPVDIACLEAGRHYFPCRDIISAKEGDFLEEVEAPPIIDQVKTARDHYLRLQNRRLGTFPPWLDAFLHRGRCCRVGRNQTVYAAAVALRDLGKSEEEAARLIAAAPFNRDGFSEAELTRTVRSGFKRR